MIRYVAFYTKKFLTGSVKGFYCYIGDCERFYCKLVDSYPFSCCLYEQIGSNHEPYFRFAGAPLFGGLIEPVRL